MHHDQWNDDPTPARLYALAALLKGFAMFLGAFTGFLALLSTLLK